MHYYYSNNGKIRLQQRENISLVVFSSELDPTHRLFTTSLRRVVCRLCCTQKLDELLLLGFFCIPTILLSVEFFCGHVSLYEFRRQVEKNLANSSQIYFIA